MPCGARPYLSHAPRAKSNNRRVVCANATSTTKSNVPLRGDPYELIADTTVFRVADEGASVRLGDLWQPTQAAVVFWARSMGCPFCWELSIRLHQDIIPRLGQNIPLYLVSIGTAQRGLDFVAKTGFPAERLLADPISSTYAALGLKKGVVDTFFNPQTPLALATRAARGELGVLQSQVLPQWEPWQPPKQDQVRIDCDVVVRVGAARCRGTSTTTRMYQHTGAAARWCGGVCWASRQLGAL